ncbi:unnamed protein product [Eruca vesicaria subsp. sativa]|uniref:Uncharacterized protein n=1 Tax=Eruca vesicaria subsp. sativa TaxID=29727 RepID=A0ABC8KJA6_ERUVS|nr:unnamed protein product [Eruca vesicaria subsp. sativa]
MSFDMLLLDEQAGYCRQTLVIRLSLSFSLSLLPKSRLGSTSQMALSQSLLCLSMLPQSSSITGSSWSLIRLREKVEFFDISLLCKSWLLWIMIGRVVATVIESCRLLL